MSFKRITTIVIPLTFLLLSLCPIALKHANTLTTWSDDERIIIDSLHLANLPSPPSSPGNLHADDENAAQLGKALFFDKELSRNGKISCATCHQAEKNFTDGHARSKGLGETQRRSMSIVGAAYSPWLYWDGRRDSLWAQALTPLEDPREHGSTRMTLVHYLAQNPNLRDAYESIFSSLPAFDEPSRFPASASPLGNATEQASWQSMSNPDRKVVNHVFSNMARAIEAYERKLLPGPGAFDQFATALANNDHDVANTILNAEQQAGLRLFIGKANCIHCHNGPLFTNNEFHNTGLFPADTLPTDRGRIEGVKQLLQDPFNCLGEEASNDEQHCAELRFVKTEGIELVAAFRTPGLRNVSANGPFMHTGEFTTIAEVLEHYNRAIPTLISDELQPLNLNKTELQQIESFLRTLDAPLSTPERWLKID